MLIAVMTACGSDSTTPGATTVAPTTTLPFVDYSKPGPVALAGTGFVGGTSLDGSAAYVQQADPAFPQLGCEGEPEPVLFRLALSGGEPELLGNGTDHLHGNLAFGKGGAIAVSEGCEGFFTALWVGTETPDGHLNGMRKVAVGPVDDGQTLVPSSFAWSRDGSYLLAAVNGFGPATSAGRVVRIEPDSGALTTVFDAHAKGGVSQVAQVADGSYVVAADGRVSIRNAQGAVTIDVAGNGFEPAADLQTLIAYGDTVSLLAPAATAPVTMVAASPGKRVTSASPSSDGRAVVFNTSDTAAGTNEVSVLTVADGKTTKVAGPGPLGRVFFSGDGTAVVFNQFRPAPDFTADVGVVRFPR